jgi:hypothetical protein
MAMMALAIGAFVAAASKRHHESEPEIAVGRHGRQSGDHRPTRPGGDPAWAGQTARGRRREPHRLDQEERDEPEDDSRAHQLEDQALRDGRDRGDRLVEIRRPERSSHEVADDSSDQRRIPHGRT